MKSLPSLIVITLIAFAAVTVASNAEDAPKQQHEFVGQVLFVSAGGSKTPLENVRFTEVLGRTMMIGDEITMVGSSDGPREYYPTGVTVAFAWDKVVYYASQSTKNFKERFASERDYIARYAPERLKE